MREREIPSSQQSPKLLTRRTPVMLGRLRWKRPTGVVTALAIVSVGLVPMISTASTAGTATAAPAGDSGTERVSVATGATPGNGASHGVDISGDGSMVVFGSKATNLVPGGTSKFDLYVRDRSSGVTEIVSVDDGGQSGSSTSMWPSISRDGKRVAFHSIANNLTGSDDNNKADVFVRDRSTNKTMLISAAADGTPANGRSQRADISADGEYVVFESDATDIVAGVPGGVQHVYSRHIDSGATKLVSQSSSEVPADRGGDSASVSADGRYVVFRTFSYDLEGSSPGDWGNIYVRDTVDGTTRVLAKSSDRQARSPAISGDGRFVHYASGFNSYVTKRTGTERTRAPIPNGRNGIATSRLSEDGRFLAVYNTDGRLYVWDRFTNKATQESLNDDGTPAAVGGSAPATFGPPGISDDGRIVAFWTKADGVVSGDTGGIEDVYVRDRGDVLEPTVTKPTFDPAEPLANEPVTITATADDSGRGDAIIAAAEVSVDDGAWQPMSAVDGSFDSVAEKVTASLDNLRSGGHEACVRATDGRGNTSVRPSCDRFTSLSTKSPIAITITRVAGPAGVQTMPFARVWAVPADGSLPRAGDWDYDTRTDSKANTSMAPAGLIEPFGTHGETITTGSGKAIVRIEAGVQPRNRNAELIDLNPRSGDQGLLLTVDLETGEWSNLDDLAPFPASCVSSTSKRDADTLPGELCFSISTQSTSGDMDDDGLLDAWETFGLSMDENPDIELDLPGWGATPDHKDLFVEYDVEKGSDWGSRAQNGLVAVQQAFARAPKDAGGKDNPDGKGGIRLWIDAPDYKDKSGNNRNDLEFPGTGGGEMTGTEEVCGVKGGDGFWDFLDPHDDGFYDEKRRSFDLKRRWVFRYALKQKDETDCGSGGQAEIGGNDFVVFNSDTSGGVKDDGGSPYKVPGGATFMHELGHTLNLRHGGFENKNHKPNYISLMNYRYTFTLRKANTGDGYLDFSPPLPPPPKTDVQTQPVGSRPALLPKFNEASPPQGAVLGADRNHDFVYPSWECEFTAIPATAPFNLFPGVDTDVTVGHAGIDADLAELPGSCTSQLFAIPASYRTHSDHNDWSKIRLAFHQSGSAADGAVELSDDEDLPDDAEIAELRRLVTTTDLAAEAVGPSDPATVGKTAEVTATAHNKGKVTAHEPKLTIELADELKVASAPATCTGSPLVCSLDPVIAGEEASVTLKVVGETEGTTTSRVTVTDPSTTDPDTSNDTVELSILVDAAEDQPGGDDPGEDQPGEDQPGEDQPGEDDPGEDQPGGDDPGEDQPGEDQPGEDQPGGGGPVSDDAGEDVSPGEQSGNDGSPSDEEPSDDVVGASPAEVAQAPGGDTAGGTEPDSNNDSGNSSAEADEQPADGSVATTGSSMALTAVVGGLFLGLGALVFGRRRRN